MYSPPLIFSGVASAALNRWKFEGLSAFEDGFSQDWELDTVWCKFKLAAAWQDDSGVCIFGYPNIMTKKNLLCERHSRPLDGGKRQRWTTFVELQTCMIDASSAHGSQQ